MTANLNIEPDIKISVNQTFGFDSDMEVEAFSKKMNLFLKLIRGINLIEIQHWQFYLALRLTKEY